MVNEGGDFYFFYIFLPLSFFHRHLVLFGGEVSGGGDCPISGAELVFA